MNYGDYPKEVMIFEVGPRDGLQNEPDFIATERKIELVNRLSEAGCTRIEVTSFVHPKWIPQMKDAKAVFSRIDKKPGVIYNALIPNMKGLELAMDSRIGVGQVSGAADSLVASATPFTLQGYGYYEGARLVNAEGDAEYRINKVRSGQGAMIDRQDPRNPNIIRSLPRDNALNVILGEAGTSSFGLIQSGALEASNVDLTEQLVNMITAQRNFQANAQMISTTDQVTQTVLNIR